MSTTNKDINVVNRISIKDGGNNMVRFQGTDHYDASSLFSDTVDLPTVGYLYIAEAGDINVLLSGSTTPLIYTFEQAGIYPLLVKRIYSTSTTVTTAYIII
jgi:hypothetical protein